MIAILLSSFNIPRNSYFHIPAGTPDNLLNYICITLLCFFSAYTVIKSNGFYTNIKDLLFTAYTRNSKFINQKFEEYCEDNIISKLAKARGTYTFALIQFEQDIPIYEIKKSERPTYEHYCITQNARTLVYFSLVTIAMLCVFSWHLEITSLIIPIVAGSMIFQILWYVWGKSVFNMRRLKIPRN